MELKAFAQQEYKRYCSAAGSEFIASEFALLKILQFIRRYNIKNILEVGVGIGTVSGSILKYSRKNLSVKVSGTEANDFCLKNIPFNMGTDFENFKGYKNLMDLPTDEMFDLIIIDGSEDELESLKSKINPGGLIIVEGDRKDQVKKLLSIFPRGKFVQLISTRRNGEYSVKNPDDYRGGLKLIFVSPTVIQYVHWVALKTVTKLKYYRRFLST